MTQYVNEIRTQCEPRGSNHLRVDAVQPNQRGAASPDDQTAPECLVLGLHGAAAVVDDSFLQSLTRVQSPKLKV